MCVVLKPARAAQAAVVTGLSARLDVAGLLALEELDEFRDGLAYSCELFLTRMRSRGDVSPAQPHRARRRRGRRTLCGRSVLPRRSGARLLRRSRVLAIFVVRDVRLDVGETALNLCEAHAQRGEFVALINDAAALTRASRVALRRLVRKATRDALGQLAHPVLLAAAHHCAFVSSSRRSTRSTTPTMAASMAAPCSPVAAVDALQPPCP